MRENKYVAAKRKVERRGSVEGEARGRRAAAPLVDEAKDVLTLWAVSGLQSWRHRDNQIDSHIRIMNNSNATMGSISKE